ncbi:molecular chaperone [Serratia quinivorans]|uniref:fimbrial biogenesis chaperone n=1 Tax=Serratia quinivorans TaxID=137545 RepID=UPI002E76FF81|nr:molecular chaperone [Serratia quinivorans]
MRFNNMPVTIVRLFACLICSYVSAGWGGGIGINTTRVVYHQQDKAVQVTLRNTTENITYLMRASVVDSRGKAVRDFEVVPPLLRVDAGSEGAVRVLFHPLIPLPTNRESLFYFYALAIPSANPLTKQGREMTGQVQMAMGNRIKLFYRPVGINDPGKNTFGQVTFSRVPGGVRASNPTPYHVNLSSLKVDGRDVAMGRDGQAVIAPFGGQVYPVGSREKKTVRWDVINDLGGVDSFTGTIQ